MKSTKLVSEFNKAFGFPIREINDIEPLESRQSRIRLLFEELAELAQAGDVEYTFIELCYKFTKSTGVMDEYGCVDDEDGPYKDGNNVDKVEELDAIADIQYLLEGKKLSSGLHEVCDEAFELVHKNNMDKIHRNYNHAGETIGFHKFELYKVQLVNANDFNSGVLLFDSNGDGLLKNFIKYQKSLGIM